MVLDPNNPFLFIIFIAFLIVWVIGSIVLIFFSLASFLPETEEEKATPYHRNKDWSDYGFSLFFLGLGVAGLLLFGALVTGGFNGGGHADGCYRLITETYGKSTIQDYHVIACP